MELAVRFLEDPVGESFFLFGARGTGKSTWCLNKYGSSARIDLLSPDILRSYIAKPERLKEYTLGQPEGTTIIVDEVQKAPQLLSVVHEILEMKKGYRFVLTGSSSRKLKHAGVDLLAGRALLRTMHPFMAAELGKSFSLERALGQGMLPVVWDSSSSSEVLKSYVGIYLREEVMLESLVRNLGDFSRFLEAIAFSHGQVLNISNVARDCRVQRKSAEGYVSILEDLLLASRIPVFQRRAKRAVTAHPKFYYFDTGVFRSLRPRGPLDIPEEINGAALEGLVYQHLRAWAEYGSGDTSLYYWRTKAGTEVDFILYGSDCFWAVEVKNTTEIRGRDLRPLKTFRDDYPECQSLMLYRGDSNVLIDGILCMPVGEFLTGLIPGRNLIQR
ncbi:MAG: ATP-binding protein [Candidatus Sabulitectum sp.]|nr:ATP-binding protein [Candidatus Sabulitectum sp.]